MDHLTSDQGRRLAFERLDGTGPEICFLPGLRSDMQGTKALRLEAWARARGRAFCRFDYSGHGQSSGRFIDGCIGDWAEDAAAVIFARPGRKLLVGSSMGGWVALLLARARPEAVAGLLLAAPAPDFTSQLPPWSPLRPEELAELARDGRVTQPNPYGDEATVLTARLFADGAAQSVLDRPLSLPMPVRLLHGDADADVPLAVSLALVAHAGAGDMTLTVLKGGDHRLSDPAALAQLESLLESLASGT